HKSGDQQIARAGVSENHARTVLRRNDSRSVAKLLRRDRLGFPRLDIRFGGRRFVLAAHDAIGIAEPAESSGPPVDLRAAAAEAASAERVANVECRAIE